MPIVQRSAIVASGANARVRRVTKAVVMTIVTKQSFDLKFGHAGLNAAHHLLVCLGADFVDMTQQGNLIGAFDDSTFYQWLKQQSIVKCV